MISYHDTVGETQLSITFFEEKAQAQDDAVYQAFFGQPTASPSSIWSYLIDFGYIDKATPLTSIRRSINTLTKKGSLRKTNCKVMGLYGRLECIWTLNK